MAKSLVIFYLALTLCCFCSTTHSATSLQNKVDRLSLINFKKAIIEDPNEVFSSWNDSVNFCDWQGVTCGRKHPDRVIALDLQSQGLVGSLSPHVGNLSFLTTIVLQNNSFRGKIPEEIGRLFRLQMVEFRNNSFSGEIPTNLSRCKNLNYLNLYHNKLVGKIPGELGSLSNLKALGLSLNNLSGTIPPSLGNLSNLQGIALDSMGLQGRIPEELSKLQRLMFVALSENNLVGEIPSGLYNISGIYIFEMDSNQLYGSIPSNIGLTLPNLQYFNVALNRFTGKIPLSFSNVSTLVGIYVTGNHFTGGVPKDFGHMPNFQSLDFSHNLLDDDLSFINSLTNCTSLKFISAGRNFLTGSLPNSLANLSAGVREIYLRNNHIHNTIPLGIGNLHNLRYLDLSENDLTGHIPIDIGKIGKLEFLAFHDNKLMGEIPSSFGNFTILSTLYLGSNNLQGSIPPSLGNCSNMLKLVLSQNNLTGLIPPQVIGLSSLSILLSLADNGLSGPLPLEVGMLTNLVELDLSNNRLSGLIPNSLGNCMSLEKLYLRGNSFEGNIPQGVSALRGLRELDVSYNNLSGEIPNNLVKLNGLEFLNLSSNHFKGEVPKDGVFSNGSAISVYGNNELCGGIAKLKLPSCHYPNPKKNKLSHSLKVIILVLVVVVPCLILVACFIIYWRRKRISERKDSSSPSSPKHQFLRVSYAQLFKATNGFSESNIVGLGSYGTVYKGIIEQGETTVAVKVVNLLHRGASKSFISECQALRTTRHRNLLKVLSVCSSEDFQGNDFKALVYEFMPNGSLDKWLHPHRLEGDGNRSNLRSLKFIERLNIAIDIASAVEYLHNGRESTIVHGDLKPNNVLLDEEMTAHVGDFGLARIITVVSNEDTQYSSSSMAVKGSIGYVAPEYGTTHQVSTQGDVYSYGILLLEMFTGKKPTDDIFKDDLSLHTFVGGCMPNNVMEVVDPSLLSEINGGMRNIKNCVANILNIGVACSAELPRNRMEMGEIVHELQKIKGIYQRQRLPNNRMQMESIGIE